MTNKKIQKFMSLLMVISFGIPFLIFPLYQGIIQILNDRENEIGIKISEKIIKVFLKNKNLKNTFIENEI